MFTAIVCIVEFVIGLLFVTRVSICIIMTQYSSCLQNMELLTDRKRFPIWEDFELKNVSHSEDSLGNISRVYTMFKKQSLKWTPEKLAE